MGAVSLLVGAGELSPADVLETLRAGPGTSQPAIIVWDMRLTRTIVAAIVGLALGVAGALMQAMTRNPLADPGLLGVSAGAGLAVVVTSGVFGVTAFLPNVWPALLGALVVSLAVYAIGFGAGKDSHATLVLAGVAITSALTGIATGLALIDPARFNTLRIWMAGSVQGRDLGTIGQASVLIAIGLLIAFLVAQPLSQLALGDDLARSLGVRVGATRVAGGAAILVLAGVGTATSGPIAFIGLMVPHLARALVGPNLKWALAYSGIAGALVLVTADIAARLVIWPAEAPAGVLTAIIGAPVLAALARGALR
ncbi:FecCD family ABC transporter permease [Actinopolymorpha pittospori]|uniref:Iron complex transport system permease protein n=2 Tax=Actinopolymorpha pittospori TaxID=648752 RepID=A0A927MQK6_9ACTN|nr:iron ABC transporter permease [Actinopolymorpha pittospori]MBE1603413.1 iron complex transport system permease protein [Actinopolymorpha pittospori]